MKGRTFRVDRAQGKLLGVCAGLSNATGIDVTIIRVAVVLAAVAGGWKWIAIAYAMLAWAGRPREERKSYRKAVAERRDDDHVAALRMQAAEHVAVSSNSRLAREIEALR